VSGLSVDLDQVDAAGHDQLAEALEAGETVVLGVVPATSASDEKAVAERIERWLDMLGLQPGPGLAISPTCGLAGADPAGARQALVVSRRVAQGFAG
jgi:methionine synthase II (cobalamin-independent)